MAPYTDDNISGRPTEGPSAFRLSVRLFVCLSCMVWAWNSTTEHTLAFCLTAPPPPVTSGLGQAPKVNLIGNCWGGTFLGLHRVLAPANPKSGHFSQIRPSPALAKFLAGFGRPTQTNIKVYLIYPSKKQYTALKLTLKSTSFIHLKSNIYYI